MANLRPSRLQSHLRPRPEVPGAAPQVILPPNMRTRTRTHINGCVCKAARELFQSRSCSCLRGSKELRSAPRGQHLVLPGDGDTARDELAVEAAVGAVQVDAPHRGELLDVQDVLAVNRLRLSAGTEAWLRAASSALMSPGRRGVHSCAPMLRTLLILRATGPCSPTMLGHKAPDGPLSPAWNLGHRRGRGWRREDRMLLLEHHP